MTLFAILMSFVASALVSALMIPRIILISFRRKLFDTVNERKVHTGIVPRLGGIAFTPALIFAYTLLYGLGTILQGVTDNREVDILAAKPPTLGLCALILLYVEGIADDLNGVNYKLKFLVQTICALLIVLSDLWINNLYGLFGVYEISPFIGQPLTVLLIVYIINAINLIDGIDGLASGLSMVALFFFGVQFAGQGVVAGAGIAFALLGALVPFFYYNVFGKVERHNKIFMGDCGSQVVGFILGLLGVIFVMPSSAGVTDATPFIMGWAVLLIPGLDAIRVMVLRMLHGRHPFKPDKTHIHHKLLALGLSQRSTLVLLLTFDVFFILINVGAAYKLNINLIFLGDIIVFCLLQYGVTLLIRARRRRQAAGAADSADGLEVAMTEAQCATVSPSEHILYHMRTEENRLQYIVVSPMPNMNSWIAYGKAAFALHNLFEHKGIENYTSSFSTDKQMPYTWVSNVVFRKLLLNIEHQKENDHIIIRYPAKSDKMAYKHWLELLKDRDPSTEPASLVPLHK